MALMPEIQATTKEYWDRRKKMPYEMHKADGGYEVTSPHGTKAKHTSKKKAKAQMRLLQGIEHGWKPERRQEGGPVEEGKGYMVGEQGPELFTPEKTGMIAPHHKLKKRRMGAKGGMRAPLGRGGEELRTMG